MTSRARTVVIGAGLTGLVTAQRLSAAGVDVLLVEGGGPSPLLHEAEGAPIVGRWRNWTSRRPYAFLDGSGIKPRLGGRSLCWHGVLLRVDETVLGDQRWPRTVTHDLLSEWDRGPALYDAVEAHLESWSGKGLRDWWLDHSGRCLPLLSERLEVDLRMVNKAVQFRGRDTSGNLMWRAYSPLFEAGGPRLARQTRTKTVACDIVVSGGSSRGVQIAGEQGVETLEADSVVLAAGTMENTRLAGAALIRATGQIPIFDNLMDHVVQGAIVSMSAADGEKLLLESGAQLHALHSDLQTYANYFVELPDAPPGRLLIDIWSMGEHHSRGHVRVPATPGSGVEIDFSFDEVDAERRVAQQGVIRAFVTRLSAVAGATSTVVDFPTPENAARTLDDAIAAARAVATGTQAFGYMCPIGSSDHEAGTLALGGPLIDEWGEVRSIKNLYVVGPCTFPRAGAANPSLTAIALTWRTCRHLAS